MGWVTAWIILHDKTSAHQKVFVFALSISINIAFVSALLNTTTTSFDTTIITTAILITTGAVIFFSIVGSVAGAIASIAGGIISATFVDVFLKGSFGIVGAVGVSVSGFIFVLLNMVHKQSEKQQCMLLFWLSYSLIFLTMAFIMIDIGNFNSRFLLLFLLIFPLLNAPLDWLSLNITRGLLQSIRHQHHGGWQAFSWALFDLILALIFLLIVSAILVLAMGYADWLTGDSYLPTILSEISRSDTAKNYYWIYPMLLTTLVPTLVHFILAGAALTLWLPHDWRYSIVDNLENNHYKTRAAAFYLTVTPFVGLLTPIALLYGLYLLLNTQSAWLGNMLLEWAKLLAGLFM
jgi:hypothetical protein